MRPGARVQAAIELLDAIIIAARDGGASADSIAKSFFRERRYIGSKDRRAVREHCYSVIRALGNLPNNGRQAMLAYGRNDEALMALFDGSQYGPAPVTEDERSELAAIVATGPVPDWLTAHLPRWMDAAEQAALFDRAPLDIRTNGLTHEELQAEFPDVEFNAALPAAARLPAGTQLAAHPLWRAGKIDIQDMGSQYIIAACEAGQHRYMVDLCAGAGGKSLGLADHAQPGAVILACDTSRARLSELPHRAHRLQRRNIETRLLNPGREMEALADWRGRADMVVVDAPCSGTGTWRRNPETRWRLNPTRLDQLLALQSHILNYASELVRPGGLLVYAVCSLLPKEGADQIAEFLSANGDWQTDLFNITHGRAVIGDALKKDAVHNQDSAHGITLTPHHDGTDGFFFTRLKKPC